MTFFFLYKNCTLPSLLNRIVLFLKSVAEDFSKWISARKEIYKEFLVPDLKWAAFQLLIKQKNLQITKIVSDSYELPEHKDMFLPMIRV